MKHRILFALCITVWTIPAMAEPHYVDLSKVANRALEDDGVANNGEGGWSDEGVNDMFIFPAVPSGKVVRNGHHFLLGDPGKNHQPTIVMLRGKATPKLPETVDVPVDKVTGKYVYFLQNACRAPRGMDADKPIATYTVHYADGTSEDIQLRYGRELRAWWTGAWYDNSGAASWPIFVGQNPYSMKWRQYIGVYAMRWTNPHPDRPITSITLASAGQAIPAIFAITIDNTDYHADQDALKADYKRPPGVPAEYFNEKLASEREAIFREMVKAKMVEGVRSLEVIAPDMLAVTLDAWVTGGPGADNAKAGALQTPETFSVRVDGKDVAPVRVGRESFEYWNGNIGPFAQNVVYWHTYYLKLPKPLTEGAECTVSVAGVEEPFRASASLTFASGKVQTRVIKVNQVAYSRLAKRRYAYLGWWAGDLGKVDYSSLSSFRVIDEKTGQPALTGKLSLRAADDPISGEQVHQMDLRELKAGQYHVVVDGLGRSCSFGVGGKGIDDLYTQTNRAFYHQRAGTALTEPYTTFTTPIHRHRVFQDGRVARDDQEGTPDNPIRTFRGGYHDAADYDVFTYHLRSTSMALDAFEMYPNAFGDGDLNIPESGNKIPDVLDEANWALLAYLDLQQDDGAVPLGRGNEQDAQRDYARSHGGKNPPYGVFPPGVTTSAEYAAVAAHYARVVRTYDADRAKTYLDSAKKAFVWAQKNPNTGSRAERSGKLMRAWAAVELYRATGDDAYHKAFRDLCADGAMTKYHWHMDQYWPTFAWPYLAMKGDGVDEDLQTQLRKRLLQKADGIVRATDEPAYRMGAGKREGLGWGNGNGGGRYGLPLLMAYRLTGEQKYLDAACLNVDFQLGCNPLSKTFITGMGCRPPRFPQIHEYLYTGPNKTGKTVQGITIFGIGRGGPTWHPSQQPGWRRWRDLGNGSAEVSSEFTITETIGCSAFLYSTLHALEAER